MVQNNGHSNTEIRRAQDRDYEASLAADQMRVIVIRLDCNCTTRGIFCVLN